MGASADFDAQHLDALPAGATIGGYVIQNMLGHGGFGITYAAKNRVTGKVVAIKEFFPSSMVRRDAQSRLVYSTANAETIAWALQKFEETTTTLCGLTHPNIVEVLDYVPANDTGYMIMELHDGHTLKQWLKGRNQPPTLEELRPILDPVMQALIYVHGRGLIHRDIAPDNILITARGRPVLIDFGSASRDLSDAHQHMLSGTVGLTKRFFTAPEQMLPKARPTPEADIYSMGAVLYLALAGCEPTDGLERKDSLFQGQADPHVPLMERLPDGCSAEAATAIDRALAVRAEARLHKMADLRTALGPPLPLEPAPPLAAESPLPPAASPPAPTPSNAKLRWAAAVAALVLAVLGGVAGGKLFADRGTAERAAQESMRQLSTGGQAQPDAGQSRSNREPAVAQSPRSSEPSPPPSQPSPSVVSQGASPPPEGPSSLQPSPPTLSQGPSASPLAASQPRGEVPSPARAQPPAPLSDSTKPAQAAAGTVIRDCPDCPEVVVLAAGDFTMGSGTTPYDRPTRKVSVAQPFAIGRNEVTFADWTACVTERGCGFRPDDQGFGAGDRPIINVSWFDARDYLAWLSKKTQKAYRLPSEAEWEYAARGGTTTIYSWGNELGRNRANCADCGSVDGGRKTSPVRSFAPNGFGLYDLAGNAAEWVEDCWNPSYRGAPKDASPRETGTCGQRVLRGGSFDSVAAYAKPTARFRYDADVRYWANGFRVVRELP